MNKNAVCRLSIDFAMVALLLVAMSYRVTGNIAHEVIGASILTLFTVHNIINIRWYKAINKGKLTANKAIITVVNLLLLLVIVVLLTNGVLLSKNIFTFVKLDDGLFVKQIHTLAAYWLFILLSIHLGLHWAIIMNAMRAILKNVNSTSAIVTTLKIISLVVIVVYGVHAAFGRDICAKLIMYYSFDFWNSEESAILYIISNLAIMGLYACITYYIFKIIRKLKKNSF